MDGGVNMHAQYKKLADMALHKTVLNLLIVIAFASASVVAILWRGESRWVSGD